MNRKAVVAPSVVRSSARGRLASLALSLGGSIVLAGANITSAASPSPEPDLMLFFPTNHQTVTLEQMLRPVPGGPDTVTFSLMGQQAVDFVDEPMVVGYVLGSVCLGVDRFALAMLESEGGSFARALRFAGADAERTLQAYLQVRRLVGPSVEPVPGPYGGFVAQAGWRPPLARFGERLLYDYSTVEDGFYTYALGDTIFEIDADQPLADEIIRLLPGPDVDSRSFGPPVEPAPHDCPGADPGLRRLLPTSLGDIDLDPFPLPPGLTMGLEHHMLEDMDDPDSVTGYLLFVSLGSSAAAYRIPEGDPKKLAKVCRRALYLRKKDMRVVDWGGRTVIIDRERHSACYVRGDMIFVISSPALAREFIRTIPLPEDPGVGAPRSPRPPT